MSGPDGRDRNKVREGLAVDQTRPDILGAMPRQGGKKRLQSIEGLAAGGKSVLGQFGNNAIGNCLQQILGTVIIAKKRQDGGACTESSCRRIQPR